MVGITKSAPARMPVGRRAVIASSLVWEAHASGPMSASGSAPRPILTRAPRLEPVDQGVRDPLADWHRDRDRHAAFTGSAARQSAIS
jgi:hypothetical protein